MKLKGWFSIVPAAALTLAAACGSSQSAPNDAQAELAEEMEDVLVVPATDDVVAANNTFAMKLFAQIAETTDEGFFFSPYSIETALGMTMAGARDTTLEEMVAALELPNGERPVHMGFGEVASGLLARAEADDSIELSVANGIFSQSGMNVMAPFSNIVTEDYGADMELWDFESDWEAGRLHVNQWVSERTEERIPDLLPPGSVDDMTRMILANAVYFNGLWQTPFAEAATRDAAFTLASGDEVQVPTMNTNAEFAHGELEGFRVAELPYGNGDLSMLLFVPESAELEDFADVRLHQVDDALSRARLNLALPRFTTESAVDLVPILREMGISAAFGAESDFTRITEDYPLYISGVFHGGFIDVNEEGTEAAAATAVVMRERSASRPTTFRVDRPFAYVIRDNTTGLVVFAGRVMDPR